MSVLKPLLSGRTVYGNRPHLRRDAMTILDGGLTLLDVLANALKTLQLMID